MHVCRGVRGGCVQMMVMKSLIEAEVPALRSDLLALHTSLWSFFGRVRRELDGDLSRLLPPVYAHSPRTLGTIFGWLILGAKTLEDVEKSRRRRPGDQPNLTRPFIMLGSAWMKEFLLQILHQDETSNLSTVDDVD